jgi:hypothetical protein
MIGKTTDEGLEYDLYCFNTKSGALFEEDDEVEKWYALQVAAEKEGLAAMSDMDGDEYWFGCLPDQTDLYAVVDKYFKEFQALGCIDQTVKGPGRGIATFDGIEYNSFNEEPSSN